MAISKFTLENGLQVTGSSNFSGTVSSSGGFTGSLFGTASYGQDANLLDGLDSSVFALTGSTNYFQGSQVISGNLNVTASLSASTITGSSITGSTLSYTTLNTTQMTSSGKIVVDNNVTIGNGKNATSTDIGIGFQALNSTDVNSNYNVAIGYQSLQANTSGSSNTAIGYRSGYSMVGGVENIFIGREAGYNNKSNSSIAIGSYALYTHAETGNNTNFALGSNALKRLITGNQNYLIGVNSGYSLVYGSNNVAVGTNALSPNSDTAQNSGSNNVAVGVASLGAVTNASTNTAIGYNSLGANTSGSSNVAIGSQALLNNTTGTFSTAVGTNALQFAVSSSQNIAIGYNAGVNLKTGSSNVYLGGYTGVDNVNNNIYISDGAGNLRLQVDSNGALSGTVITGSTITGSTAQFTTITGSNISGALIGTLNTISVINAGTNLTASNVGSIRSLSLTSSVTGLTSISSSTGNFTILTGSTISGSTALFTNITASNISGTSNLYIGGNIGIGTLSPATQLDVRGTGSFYSIKFPSVQSSSTDPNTLDDYEEGTWTPALSASTTNTGFTYNTTNTSGSYIKVGKMVRLTGRLTLTATGSAAGDIYITGLPLTNADTGQGNFGTMNVGLYQNFSASVGGLLGRISPTSNVITVSRNSVSAVVPLLVTDLTKDADFIFTVHYNHTT